MARQTVIVLPWMNNLLHLLPVHHMMLSPCHVTAPVILAALQPSLLRRGNFLLHAC